MYNCNVSMTGSIKSTGDGISYMFNFEVGLKERKWRKMENQRIKEDWKRKKEKIKK